MITSTNKIARSNNTELKYDYRCAILMLVILRSNAMAKPEGLPHTRTICPFSSFLLSAHHRNGYLKCRNEGSIYRLRVEFEQTLLFNSHQAHVLSTSIEGTSLETEEKLLVIDANIAKGSGKTSEIIRKKCKRPVIELDKEHIQDALKRSSKKALMGDLRDTLLEHT
ncbi:hypothetical protein Tco_0221416 [Tanacetum coccineum]